MKLTKHAVFVLFLGTIIRILLFSWEMDTIFSKRAEFSTPVSSVYRLFEGKWLQSVNMSIYSGDGYHRPPLLLDFFTTFVAVNDGGFTSNRVNVAMFYILLDICIAFVLFQSGGKEEISDMEKATPNLKKETKKLKVPEKHKLLSFKNALAPIGQLNPVAPMAFFFLNPLSIASCVAMTSCNIDIFFVVLLQWRALAGDAIITGIAIAFATYLNIYHVVQLIPSFLLLKKNPSVGKVSLAMLLFTFVGCFGALVAATWKLNGESFDFIQHTYIWEGGMNDLYPNIGLWWYFFIELFDRFRNYFLFLFNIHIYTYAFPLTAQFYDRPQFLSQALVGTHALFRPYPELSGIGLVFANIMFHPRTLERMRNLVAILVTITITMCLLPLMWFMWLESGSGNSNYFYFQALVFAMANAMFQLECIAATMRRDRLSKKYYKNPTAEYWMKSKKQ